MNLPTEFLTTESLYTLAGLSLVVYLLVEVFRVYLTRVEGVIPVKTVACLIGMALAVILVIAGAEPVTPQAIILAVANGAMAGLLATGGAAVVNAARTLGQRRDSVAAAGADPVVPAGRNRWGDHW